MMRTNKALIVGCVFAAMTLGPSTIWAAKAKAPTEPALTESGQTLKARYAGQLKALQLEITGVLPAIDSQMTDTFQKARQATKTAEAEADTAQKALGKIQAASGLVDHAKGKWIGGAEKGIAQAQAALKKATTDAQRDAAKADLAKWQANKEEGLKALKERQEALEKAKAGSANAAQMNQAAQTALAKALATELTAVKAILANVEPFLSSDKLDAKLVRCAVLAEATPGRLAEFAQQGKAQEALVEKLLGDDALMKQMLIAGGAENGKYGRAIEIYTAIQKASAKANEGLLQRLALGVSLEHAVPVAQSNPPTAPNAAAIVDPVKRYLHYEKAYLDGELDPAFKSFSAWEYRMIVQSDAPDHILSWGREMLRNYRPDHTSNPDYGWRYSATVRTEVTYGSQNVKLDLPSLHNYQNIIKNGGVCGRRAFFGRFIVQSFGIPTWGVTQHKHAALGHWTPKGWVINLGAGFQHSWWDKDQTPRSGTDFLLETQARTAPGEYLKVLRAQWVSSLLGEQAYNGRKSVAGGFWSSMAHYQAQAIATAAKMTDLGPLGQELAEANESKAKEKIEQPKLADTDKKIVVGQDRTITIPAVAHSKASGHSISMKNVSGGMQLHCSGGFKADYAFEIPHGGKYLLAARVVTVQDGQKFRIAPNNTGEPIEIAVPYTVGLWQQTQPVEVTLANGKNVLHFALQDGSRGVTIKEFTLTPVK